MLARLNSTQRVAGFEAVQLVSLVTEDPDRADQFVKQTLGELAAASPNSARRCSPSSTSSAMPRVRRQSSTPTETPCYGAFPGPNNCYRDRSRRTACMSLSRWRWFAERQPRHLRPDDGPMKRICTSVKNPAMTVAPDSLAVSGPSSVVRDPCPAARATQGSDPVRRDILPMPASPHVGLTTYDAKDPDTTYPPIRTCGHLRARRMCSSS